MRSTLLWMAALAGTGAVVYFFSNIVGYICGAVVLAMLGRPLKDFFQTRVRVKHWYLGPTGASLLTLLCFFGAVAGFFLLFVPTIAAQIRHLSAVNYAALGEKLRGPLSQWDTWLHQVGLWEGGQSLGKKMQESLLAFFQPRLLGDWIGGLLSAAGGIGLAILSVSFISFFFLKEEDLLTRFVYSLMPDPWKRKALHAMEEAGAVLTRYLRGLALQTLSFMAIAAATLWLLGVPNALLLGILGGLFNIIPYLGPLIGIAVGCFFTLIHFIEADFSVIGINLLKVIGAFGFTQLLDNVLLYPYITSTSVRAHPLEIFLVVLAAAQIAGPLGMIVGVPLYTVIRAVVGVFFSEFRIVQHWTGQSPGKEPHRDERS
jgi:predicted PurR-regulated permease PerM